MFSINGLRMVPADIFNVFSLVLRDNFDATGAFVYPTQRKGISLIIIKRTRHILCNISLLFRIVEHPFHNNLQASDRMVYNDFALLELTGQVDMSVHPYVNSACLPSMAPVLLTDKVRQQNQVKLEKLQLFIL